ncbi:MAG: transcriptional regulator [Cyanobacteria bacterium P01_E01_bin.42]
MKTVKTPVSDSWLDAFRDRLQDPEEAAEYLNVILEDDPKGDDILRYALSDIIKAKLKSDRTSESEKLYYRKLEQCFANGGEEIYNFIELLTALGFTLEVKRSNESET